jgi:predicted DNA-binding transcriptional regulator AlpA
LKESCLLPREYQLPENHHLDRRAHVLLEVGSEGGDDDLLPPPAIADWLGLTSAWLAVARSKGYGPPFIKLSATRVRYRRGDVRQWLAERTKYHDQQTLWRPRVRLDADSVM